MWIARNKDGHLRMFELPPRRFHDGACLNAELVGFDDAVSVGDGQDIYSFWAIQKYYQSNVLEKDSYGIRLMKSCEDDSYETYIPDFCKDLKWEDDPIEISILPTSFVSEVNHLTDAICGSILGIPEGMTNGDVLVSMKKVNEQLKGICG